MGRTCSIPVNLAIRTGSWVTAVVFNCTGASLILRQPPKQRSSACTGSAKRYRVRTRTSRSDSTYFDVPHRNPWKTCHLPLGKRASNLQLSASLWEEWILERIKNQKFLGMACADLRLPRRSSEPPPSSPLTKGTARWQSSSSQVGFATTEFCHTRGTTLKRFNCMKWKQICIRIDVADIPLTCSQPQSCVATTR